MSQKKKCDRQEFIPIRLNHIRVGSARPVDDPYEVWVGPAGFQWNVLKKYQKPENEAKNPYARWFVAAKSDMTDGRWEYGDTYISDITEMGVRVK